MLSQQNQTPNRHLRRVAAEIAREVLTGRPLSASMARYPWLFDRMQVRIVEAGEHGGLLIEVLRRLADHLQREWELRLEIKRRTLYPKILLLAFFVIPAIPTLVLEGLVPFLLQVWGTMATLVIVAVPTYLVGRYLLTTLAGRNAYDQIKLELPWIGALTRKLAVARFARTVAALYGAGVPIQTATLLAGEASGNYVLETGTARIVHAVERGEPLSRALSATRFFPPMFLGMIETGEASGSLDEILNKAAEFYEEEALHAIVQLTVILGVLLLIGMAVVIAIRVIQFYTGYVAGVFSGAGGGE
jgi:type IV pilus assembly protein PilC